MSPRERVVVVLSQREPDRVPVDLGATHNSSIHIDAYNKLKEYLDIQEEEKVKFVDIIQQAVTPGEEVLKILEIDTRIISAKSPKSWKLTIHE